MIIIFAMPGCPACEDYQPKFEKQLDAYMKRGELFQYYDPSLPLHPLAIPVLIIDATSPDPGIQSYLDASGINAMPTTLFFVRGRTVDRREGSLSVQEIRGILDAAVAANR